MSYKIKKAKRRQVTCGCKAYSFPHRLSGGKCTLNAWVSEYYYNNAVLCKSCPCNRNNTSCDVVEGQENTKYCEALMALENYTEVNFKHK